MLTFSSMSGNRPRRAASVVAVTTYARPSRGPRGRLEEVGLTLRCRCRLPWANSGDSADSKNRLAPMWGEWCAATDIKGHTGANGCLPGPFALHQVLCKRALTRLAWSKACHTIWGCAAQTAPRSLGYVQGHCWGSFSAAHLLLMLHSQNSYVDEQNRLGLWSLAVSSSTRTLLAGVPWRAWGLGSECDSGTDWFI